MRDNASVEVGIEKVLFPSSTATASAELPPREAKRLRTIQKAFPRGKVAPKATDEGDG